jgi:hypothetical protein
MHIGTKIAIAAALACIGATPAAAAPQDDAQCILEPVRPTDRVVMTDQLLRDGTVDPTPVEREVHGRFMARVMDCAGRMGWSTDHASLISAFAASVVVRGELRSRLAASGVDVAYVDRWLARQSDAFRTGAFIVLPEGEVDAAMATLTGRELSQELFAANRDEVSFYIASSAFLERADRGMDQSQTR